MTPVSTLLSHRWTYLLIALAALSGAAGVMAAAAAAHGNADPNLKTVADFLILHAAAVIAIAAAARAAPRRGAWLLAAGTLLIAGNLLFCGDLSIRAIGEARLFPMAAPVGGSLLIAGWAAVALAAVGVAWTPRI